MDEQGQRRLMKRVTYAEHQIQELQEQVRKANKRVSSSAAIVVFVILALIIYHFGWVSPIIRSHNSLVDTVNHNANTYNSNLYR